MEYLNRSIISRIRRQEKYKDLDPAWDFWDRTYRSDCILSMLEPKLDDFVTIEILFNNQCLC